MTDIPSKSLTLAFPKVQPALEKITGIVLMGAHLGLSVCVMCLTQDLLDQWTDRLSQSPSVVLLDLLNTNRATLTDWKAFLSAQTYDIVVLHGAYTEMKQGRLSVRYLNALVKAVDSGLVMVI